MKGAFVYNQETGCVPKSELKMSVYEHGQFLRWVFFLKPTIFLYALYFRFWHIDKIFSPDQKSKLMSSIDSLSKKDHQVDGDYLSLALCTACIDISANTSNATILMAWASKISQIQCRFMLFIQWLYSPFSCYTQFCSDQLFRYVACYRLSI